MKIAHPICLAACLSCMVHAADSQRPNVVFILADDLGWRDLACYGSTFYETSHLDRLAARGIRFTQAYAANPLCSPTRTSILTGLYPARVGITEPRCHLKEIRLEKSLAPGNPGMRAIPAQGVTRLKPDYYTLAEALRDGGYRTAHFGKWHLGYNLPDNRDDHYEPRDQGFDFDFPHTPRAAGPDGGYLAPWAFIRVARELRGESVGDDAILGQPGEHIEDRMSAEAAKFIRENKDRPFYLNYWAYSVHSPYSARADYVEHFKPKADSKNPQRNPLYAAMVKSLDDAVGRLLDAIDAAGIADRTIIVFTSDNGGEITKMDKTNPAGFADQPATSNLPLRSGKASIYEGGTREPLIVVWPGRAKAGTTTDALFQSVDFYPTLVAMCGLALRADPKHDGFNQTAAILGGASARDRVFCHFPHGNPTEAVEYPGYLPSTYVRHGDWKLIRFYADNADGTDRLELYNLRDDIGELHNLAATQLDRVREMNALIDAFLRDTEAVIPIRNPNYKPETRR